MTLHLEPVDCPACDGIAVACVVIVGFGLALILATIRCTECDWTGDAPWA